MKKRQFSLKTLMLATFVVACFISTTVVTVNRTSRNIQATRSAYAAQLVAYMCVEHMKLNKGHWPENWGDLADDLERGYANSGQKRSWTIADLRQRVHVDWTPNLQLLKSHPKGDSVVWISDSPDREFYMTSPNEIVFRYLQSTDQNGNTEP